MFEKLGFLSTHSHEGAENLHGCADCRDKARIQDTSLSDRYLRN
jgi:hypothetical protein